MAKEPMETQIAVFKRDMEYIKKSLDAMSSDIKEMKGAYVPYNTFIEARDRARMEHEEFITRDQFKPWADKLRTLWTGGVTVITLILITILTAVLSLVIKK